MQDGNSAPITLKPNSDTSFGLGAPGRASQVHLQIFPSGQAFPEVVTLIVSAEQSAAGGPVSVVGQAFTGGI